MSPPPEPVMLWTDGGRTVYIEESWGPAVPYHPVHRDNGTTNHGYLRVKGDPAAVAQIPEARGWQELQGFLLAVNAPDSPIESVGCEKSYSPVEVASRPTVKLGSYVDLIFSETRLNDRAENQLLLASRLLDALEGCGQWWSEVEMGLQRYRGVAGASAPWGLLLRTVAYGRGEEEARKFWRESLRRMARAIGALPADFRWNRDNT